MLPTFATLTNRCLILVTVVFAQLSIGIEADAAGISIPASSISVRYRCIPVPDWGTLIPVPDIPAFRHLIKCVCVCADGFQGPSKACTESTFL